MLKYWLWLSLLEGISVRKKAALLQHFPGAEELYLREDYSGGPELTEQDLEALLNKDLSEAQRTLNACRRKDIDILTIEDEAYPVRLRNIPDPPIVLYYRGVLPDFDTTPAIGVVGTRKATAYGVGIARIFGKQIAQGGGIVVSGGAAGIDSAALKGALEKKGQTVAVLGCGVDITYPTNNRKLFDEIRLSGCLISEYPPGSKPLGWHFPIRNRIISGMSNGIVVIEAPEKSGALITARDALEQGKDVYAVPGNIDMPTCQGSNRLLSSGATAVFSGWDILKEYAPLYPERVREPQAAPEKPKLKVAQPVQLPVTDKKDIDNPADSPYIVTIDEQDALTPEENSILACLTQTPKSMDELLAQLDIPAGEALKIITRLSLKGLVVNHPGRMVSVKRQHK